MAKIAVVDDAPEVLQIITKMLRNANHQVVSFDKTDGLEDNLALEKPDLLLLDIVLPERNGYQILRSLKKHEALKALPVVLVSSKNQESDVRWGLRQGAEDYITKPFTAEQLLGTIRRFVR